MHVECSSAIPIIPVYSEAESNLRSPSSLGVLRKVCLAEVFLLLENMS
jgi:hypothetical protein